MRPLRQRALTWAPVVLALCLAPAPAPAVAHQEDAPASEEAEPAVQNQPDAAAARRRIVDKERVSTRSPLPARILLAPFRALAPGTERGLNTLETTNFLQRIEIVLTNPHVRPLVGSVGDGSGFGLGVAASSHEAVGALRFFATVHPTTKRYLESAGGLEIGRGGSAEQRRVALSVTGFYRARPQEDFWGTGPDFTAQRTNYNLQERGVDAAFTFRATPQLRFSTGVQYARTTIFSGKDARFPTTDSVFPPTLPGLAGGSELLSPYFLAEFDTRAGATAPVKAFYTAVRVSSSDSVGGGDFGFWSYEVDSRFYLPLWSNRRVLAARTLLTFHQEKGGSEIPFYRLARLGDSRTLRGYDSSRFHGRNAAAWNLEYRTDLTFGVGAFAFTDFGQVFDRRSQFTTGFFRVTYGGGLQFKGERSMALRIYLARSEEGSRFFFTFGPTF